MKFTDLMPVGIALLVAAVAITVGADILSEMGSDDFCATGYTWNESQSLCTNGTGAHLGGAGNLYAANATLAGSQGLGELGGWLPTIALVIAAAIVITTLVASFAMRK